jgi:hypothetical protein
MTENKEIFICRIWGSHSSGYDDFYLVGYNVIYSSESQLMVQRNVTSIFRVEQAKQETSVKQVNDMPLQNVGWLSMDYIASYPRKQNSINIHMYVIYKYSEKLHDISSFKWEILVHVSCYPTKVRHGILHLWYLSDHQSDEEQICSPTLCLNCHLHT